MAADRCEERSIRRFHELLDEPARDGHDLEMTQAADSQDTGVGASAPPRACGLRPASSSAAADVASGSQPTQLARAAAAATASVHSTVVSTLGISPLQLCLLLLIGITGTATLSRAVIYLLPKQLAPPPSGPLSSVGVPAPPSRPPPSPCAAVVGRRNLRGDGTRRSCHDAVAAAPDDAAACTSAYITACADEPCPMPDGSGGSWSIAVCEYNATASHCFSNHYLVCDEAWMFMPASPPPPSAPSPNQCLALVGRSNLRANGSRSSCHDALTSAPADPAAACHSSYITSCTDEPCSVPGNNGDRWAVSFCQYDGITGRCYSDGFVSCEEAYMFMPAPPPPPPMTPQPRAPPPSPCAALIGRTNLRREGQRRSCHDSLAAHPANPEHVCETSFITSCDAEPCSVPNGQGERVAVAFCEYDRILKTCSSSHFTTCAEEWMDMLSPP